MSASGLIVMAVYRPDHALLRRQLQSIAAQTLADWRCIVGIDGADPAARALASSIVEGDVRFEIIEFDENLGVYRHFERLLMQGRQDAAWIALADQDDYWYPTKLERLTAELTLPGVSGVSGQARLVDADGQVLGYTQRRPGTLSDAILKNQATGSLSVFATEVVRHALPFPESRSPTAIHDHWLGVVAAALGEFRVLGASVQDYVQHDSNVLGEVEGTSVRSELERVRTHGGIPRHLDRVSLDRWGWRVDMAATLLCTLPNTRDDRFVQKAATAYVSTALARGCATAVLRRRLRFRGAIGVLAGAAWWPYAIRRAKHG